jgi:hypothetical protein
MYVKEKKCRKQRKSQIELPFAMNFFKIMKNHKIIKSKKMKNKNENP